jgi:hypothetical protein
MKVAERARVSAHSENVLLDKKTKHLLKHNFQRFHFAKKALSEGSYAGLRRANR